MKDKDKSKKGTFKLWEVLLITLSSSLIMSLSTGYVVFRGNWGNVKNLTNSKYLNEFVNSYNNIIDNYYDDIDEDALVDAAINGMLNYLGDPYTTYLDESNTNLLTDSLSGTYEGIGVKVTNTEENKILITNVLDDSPASKSGILVGDIISKIDGTDLNGKTANDAVNLIKSNNTNNVELEISRDGEIINYILEKSNLYIPSIYKEIFNQNDKKVGYIQISKFSDTVYNQFNKELTSLEESNIDSLIVDLRNNTGGYLSGATNIAEIFLEKGKIIYSLESKMDKEDIKDTSEEHRNYKVFVLINHSSASASEVLASALKYSYGATLVGTTSYGKGKVQKTSKLNDGTMYKYTSAKWLTPNGDCVDEVGIVPDIVVELSEKYVDEPTFENDNQIQTAIYEIAK